MRDMKKFADKPYVSLGIEGGGTCFTILVNDIPIYFHYDYDTVTFEMPINQYLQNGENALEIDLIQPLDEDEQPIKGDVCCIKVSINVKEAGGEELYTLGTLNYTAPSDKILNRSDEKYIINSSANQYLTVSNGKIETTSHDDSMFVIGRPVIKADATAYYGYNFNSEKIDRHSGVSVSNIFKIKLPYENEMLILGESLVYGEQTKKKLLEEYKQIVLSIKEKKFSSLKPLFKERTKNRMRCLYLNDKEADVLKSFEESECSPGFVLSDDIIIEDVFLNIFGGNKLAQLTYWDGSPIIGFALPNNAGSRMYNLIFAKINGEWKVV